jgi:hypothetical protein
MNPTIYGFCNHPEPKPGGTMVDLGKNMSNTGSIYECPFCENRVFGGSEENNPCASGNTPGDAINRNMSMQQFQHYKSIAMQHPGIILPSTYNDLEQRLFPDLGYVQTPRPVNWPKPNGGSEENKKIQKSKKN